MKRSHLLRPLLLCPSSCLDPMTRRLHLRSENTLPGQYVHCQHHSIPQLLLRHLRGQAPPPPQILKVDSTLTLLEARLRSSHPNFASSSSSSTHPHYGSTVDPQPSGSFLDNTPPPPPSQINSKFPNIPLWGISLPFNLYESKHLPDSSTGGTIVD